MDTVTRNILLTCFIILFSVEAKAQRYFGGYGNETASVGLVAGYSGFRNNFIELGIGFQPWDVEGEWVGYPFAGFLLLHEIEATRKLYGNSCNFWYLSGPFACGLGVNRYSDHKSQTFGIKPMIGVSIYRIGIMFGYNFFLNKNEIPNLGHASMTVKYYLPVWNAKVIGRRNLNNTHTNL
jgi:hypothetical protein